MAPGIVGLGVMKLIYGITVVERRARLGKADKVGKTFQDLTLIKGSVHALV
jgi:hypothetical protein